MKYRRILALLLAVLMLCLMTACGTEEETTESEKSAETTGTEVDPTEIALVVNDKEITWGEISYWVYFQISQYYSTYNDLPNLSLDFGDSGTFGDMFLNNAIHTATRYAAMDIYAEENGIELLEVDEIGIDNYMDTLEEQYGGADAFDEALVTMGCTREDFREIQRLSFVSQRIYKTLYGPGGDKLTEEQMTAFAEDNGYVQAKMIIVMKADEDGNPLDDAAIAAADAKIDEVYAKLTAWSETDNQGYDSLSDYFDAMIKEYNEDETTDYFPDGYLFAEGEMIDGAYQAVKNAGENELAEVLKLDACDAVLLRVPVDYNTTPFSYLEKVQEGGSYTFRQYVATVLFDQDVDAWTDSVEAKNMPILATIDPAEYFAQ